MAEVFRPLLLVAALVTAPATSYCAEWKATRLSGPGSVKNSGQLHPAVSCRANSCFRSKERPFFNEGRPAPNGLPDGKIATSRKFKDIGQAWYILPTRRYDHGILGDAIEAGGLSVKLKSGNILSLKLPKDQVFEDRIPRIADLDGDGRAEIITILSSLSKGGSIAIYSVTNSRLVKRSQTPFIGRPYRWLNIAGIADFDGNGQLDIAGVWTPHIGGTLKFWTLMKGRLKLIGRKSGFSNHFIGSHEQRLSATGDVDGNGVVDLVLPSADRKTLQMVGFIDGKPRELGTVRLKQQIDKAVYLRGRGEQPIVTLGLADGSTLAVHR